MVLSLWRVIKFAWQDIGRNLGLSFMTVFILVLMLLSVNVLWTVDTVTKEAIKLIKDEINVSFYLRADINDKETRELSAYLNSFSEVIDLKTMSRADVLQSFKTRHQLSPEVLQALEELGGNPFGPTLIIKTKEPGDYTKIIHALEVPEYEHLIESKSFDQHEDAINKIQTITNRIDTLGLGLTALFAVISFFIIFNTIRVAITTHRTEISIKRLVGANSFFIRGPYLVESVIFTVISIAATATVIFGALRWIDPYLSVVFSNSFSLTNYYQSHTLYLFGIQAAAVLFLTVLSSGLAMRKQLKV